MNKPTLTDPRGMGGVIAQDGFDYQLWDGLARLPAWLTNPTFDGILFEGLEDLEARFFAPHAPREYLLDRFQAKSGNLSPTEVGKVLQNFRDFDTAYPQVARVQTLVTPRMPPTLARLAHDPARVQAARPFYAPFADVAKASDDRLRADLVGKMGDLGNFVAESVEVVERVLPDRATAMQAFGQAMAAAFPSLDLPWSQVSAAFEELSALGRQNLGRFLERAALVGAIETALGRLLFPQRPFPLHIRSDRNAGDETALEIDARDFAGGASPFPPPEVWLDRLAKPLDRTSKWLRQRGLSRIGLSGSYRLSTAFAIGWSLRSAVGFEIEIPTREGAWATDDRPDAATGDPAWTMRDASALRGDRLIVAVGILRDPAADLVQAGLADAASVLAATMPAPITSAKAAQAAVATLKRLVDGAASRLRPNRIDLYLAGPAAFAVALGHRWNAMPPTQLHEFTSSNRRYFPTALV